MMMRKETKMTPKYHERLSNRKITLMHIVHDAFRIYPKTFEKELVEQQTRERIGTI